MTGSQVAYKYHTSQAGHISLHSDKMGSNANSERGQRSGYGRVIVKAASNGHSCVFSLATKPYCYAM